MPFILRYTIARWIFIGNDDARAFREWGLKNTWACCKCAFDLLFILIAINKLILIKTTTFCSLLEISSEHEIIFEWLIMIRLNSHFLQHDYQFKFITFMRFARKTSLNMFFLLLYFRFPFTTLFIFLFQVLFFAVCSSGESKTKGKETERDCYCSATAKCLLKIILVLCALEVGSVF